MQICTKFYCSYFHTEYNNYFTNKLIYLFDFKLIYIIINQNLFN